MRISDLYKSVAQLGFEDTLESDTRFFFAANRALLQVAALRPAIRSLTISHVPLRNRLSTSTFLPVQKKGELCFSAGGVKSYYFECDGTGQCFVERWDAENGAWRVIGHRDLSANRVFKAYRGLVKEDGVFIEDTVRLRFVGEYLYSVRNVALYGEVFSASEADVPAFLPHTRYDISSMVEDFLSLELPVFMESGGEYVRLADGYDVENGRVLLLPYDADGTYKVQYKHRPAPIESAGSASEEEALIDLDEELCALLPFLIASIVWADDEPQKAEYYLSIYRERASVLISAFIDNIPYVATMIPVIAGIAVEMGIDPTVLYFGLLSGATLGGNCTPIGASANIAGIGILRKEGHEVKNSDFFKIGIPFTMSAVIPAYIVLWLLFGV